MLRAAIRQHRHPPDLRVALVADHQEAVRKIPWTPIIMVTGGTAHRDVEASLSAIRLGALTVLPKPSGPRRTSSRRIGPS